MAVVSRREPVFWELLPLEGTQNWRNYVNISSSRGLPLVLFIHAFKKISFRTEAGGDHEGQGDIVSEETETMHEPHEEGGELDILEDDRHAAQEPRQATGQADEGKNIPEIVEEFQRECEEQHNAMNDNSSDDDDDDDEDYHVPHNWSGYRWGDVLFIDGVIWSICMVHACLSPIQTAVGPPTFLIIMGCRRI